VLAEDRSGEARYRVLETIHEYAAEKLREAGEEALLEARHRDWFVRLAEQARDALDGPEQGAWLARLEAEHDNLRAVLRRGLRGVGDPAVCLDLCVALGYFWATRGHVSEGRRWLDEALARADRAPAAVRARLLCWAGKLAAFQDYHRGRALLDEALELQRALGETHEMCRTLYALGKVSIMLGDLDRAAVVSEQSLELARGLGDTMAVALAGDTLGEVARSRGDFDRAARRFEESLAIFRERGSRRNSALMLLYLGDVSRSRGELDRAERHLGECLEIARELGDNFIVAAAQLALGNVATERGHYDGAISLCAGVLVLLRELDNRQDMASVLDEMACAVGARGDPERALRLAGAASGLRETARRALQPSERAALDRWLDAFRRALGPQHAERAYDEGRAMPFEEALDYALGSE
jgi:tetratricopeptide (TPR) repeat protein